MQEKAQWPGTDRLQTCGACDGLQRRHDVYRAAAKVSRDGKHVARRRMQELRCSAMRAALTRTGASNQRAWLQLKKHQHCTMCHLSSLS
eukprot:354234-Chlamydomonas_euryale.AAC.12